MRIGKSFPSPLMGEGQDEGEKRNKITFAKQLRNKQTNAEKLLWFRIRNKQVAGAKFRRQQVIGKYIVDFVSFEKKIIIELDGGQHNEEYNKYKDLVRTKWLEQGGFQVIRFWDNDVLTKIEDVLLVISAEITPLPNPLPQGERE